MESTSTSWDPIAGHSSSYRLYGLTLESDFPFASHLLRGMGAPDLRFSLSTAPPCPAVWEKAEPVYASPFLTENGESDYAVYRQADRDILRYTDVADFYVQPARIVGHLLDPSRKHDVELLLLGSVLSYWLEREGVPALHASAAVVNGRAVAFLAHNRGGKSSLVAALMQAGHPLLTDDILPLELRDGVPIGQPGYPQMRFWPDQALHFLGRYEDLPLVHPSVTKRRVRVGPGGLGTFCDTARPLACLYLPMRRDPDDPNRDIEIQPASFLDTFKELVRYSFLPRTVEALGWQPQRLKLFARIAAHAPLHRLVYPSGVEHLPRVRQAILDDLRRL